MSDVYVCMHKHARLGGSRGHASPRKLDALRLVLRPFWDRRVSGSIATWLAEYNSIASNIWLAYAFTKPADFE